MASLIGWLFEDRQTGRLVVAQWPNIPVLVWVAATLLRRSEVATGALLVWALLEVFKGVNPFRRMLGTAVLIGLLVTQQGTI